MRGKSVDEKNFSMGHIFAYLESKALTALSFKECFQRCLCSEQLWNIKLMSLSTVQDRLSITVLSLLPCSNPSEHASSTLKMYPESNSFSIFLWLTIYLGYYNTVFLLPPHPLTYPQNGIAFKNLYLNFSLKPR